MTRMCGPDVAQARVTVSDFVLVVQCLTVAKVLNRLQLTTPMCVPVPQLYDLELIRELQNIEKVLVLGVGGAPLSLSLSGVANPRCVCSVRTRLLAVSMCGVQQLALWILCLQRGRVHHFGFDGVLRDAV